MLTNNTSRTVAELLLKIEAVHCNLGQPYVFTSGTVSPVYVDCRKLVSFPKERRRVINLACRIIEERIGKDNVDVVAGGETAGIPFAAFLAERLRLPMVYVRKQPKSFGRLQQIEGYFEEGEQVLLVEDLIFDAKSKLNFCEGIRGAGGIVKHILVVFDYGNPKSRRNLERHGLTLHALTDWNALLESITKKKYFSQREIEATRDFLANPENWHLKQDAR